MLKTTRLPDKPVPSKNDNSRLVSSRNNSYNEVEFGGSIGNSMDYAKKLGKLKS